MWGAGGSLRLVRMDVGRRRVESERKRGGGERGIDLPEMALAVASSYERAIRKERVGDVGYAESFCIGCTV